MQHQISVSILAEITGRSENKIRKIYKQVIADECIPLSEIPRQFQEIYVREYLFRDQIIDFSFIDSITNLEESQLIASIDVKELFREMEMLRKGLSLSKSYATSGNLTEKLTDLAKSYGYSYVTYCRRRKIYMNNSSLRRALLHDSSTEDTYDRYRTVCFYCRDLIIFLHEKPGKISAAKIFRDINKIEPVKCSECPYHPEMKNKPHRKGCFIPEATCHRNLQTWVTPNCDDTVCAIIKRIPKQQDVLAWEGVRSWGAKFHYTPPRKKPDVVNKIWFADHKRLDVLLRVAQLPDGRWKIARPWITAILDCASNVLVSYVLSLNPNSDCIAECFARACAFTVDTPYAGIPDVFYIDNGKDFRSKRLDGLPNSDEPHLYLNKNFGESGILEWFGIKVIHALPYRGWSKSIESIWRVFDREWFKKLPGYCGENPQNRPYTLDADIAANNLYLFPQFADYFADTVYPEYNDFAVSGKSPNELYRTLPKASSYVPTWRTLSVLKSVSDTRDIGQKGIRYDNKLYWCSELSPLIGTKNVRIFAFDTPFNRNISVVKDHEYIGEAHMIERLNVVEKQRHKVVEHVVEQQRHRKHYSTKINILHNIVLQTDASQRVLSVPAVDDIRYGQAIDVARDKSIAQDDKNIPNELKEQAIRYAENLLNSDDEREPGITTNFLYEIGKKARQNI